MRNPLVLAALIAAPLAAATVALGATRAADVAPPAAALAQTAPAEADRPCPRKVRIVYAGYGGTRAACTVTAP